MLETRTKSVYFMVEWSPIAKAVHNDMQPSGGLIFAFTFYWNWAIFATKRPKGYIVVFGSLSSYLNVWINQTKVEDVHFYGSDFFSFDFHLWIARSAWEKMRFRVKVSFAQLLSVWDEIPEVLPEIFQTRHRLTGGCAFYFSIIW